MNQLELLWDYQTADIEVERISKEIKSSPERQKLVKYRDYLVEQQETMKRIEDEILTMQDRLEALNDAVHRIEEQIENVQSRLNEKEPESIEEVDRFINDVQRLQNNLADYEAEIARIRKDAANRDHLQHDVKIRAVRTKQDFDKLKAVYDEKYAEMSQRLKAAKAVTEEKAKAITPDYMEKYRVIKQHSFPPLARLSGDKCGGCNMALPAGVVKDVQGGKEIECETCGRLLII